MRHVLFINLLFLFLSLTACSDSNKQVVIQGETMGTFYSIKLIDEKNIDKEELKYQIDTLLIAINDSMSTYIPNSELSKLNQSTSTDWQTISQDLFNVIDFSQTMSDISNGAFDISVGPLVNLWGFGPNTTSLEVPDDEVIQSTLKKTGYKNISLNSENISIKKSFAEIHIDLSAIAKGYGVDRIAELLENKSITNYMVEIGGEVKASGINTKGQAWQIGIEKPQIGERHLQRVIALNNQAIASSGNYRNFFEKDGKFYSHTITPQTGHPVDHSLASVTVIADYAMTADAWATTLMVLGEKKGLKLAEEHKVAALFISHSHENKGEFSETYTSSFPK